MGNLIRDAKAYEAFIRTLKIVDGNLVFSASDVLMEFIDDVLMSLRASNSNTTPWNIANSMWGFISGKQSSVFDVAWTYGVSTHVISGHTGKIAGCFKDDEIKKIIFKLLDTDKQRSDVREEVLTFLENKLTRLGKEAKLVKKQKTKS